MVSFSIELPNYAPSRLGSRYGYGPVPLISIPDCLYCIRVGKHGQCCHVNPRPPRSLGPVAHFELLVIRSARIKLTNLFIILESCRSASPTKPNAFSTSATVGPASLFFTRPPQAFRTSSKSSRDELAWWTNTHHGPRLTPAAKTLRLSPPEALPVVIQASGKRVLAGG